MKELITKQRWRFYVCIIVLVIAAFYAGACFDFLPFLFDDPVICAIGFATVIICTVLAICTCILVDKLEELKKSDKLDEDEKDTPAE